ncbi:hypothetical protein AC249_AIPGENE21410 [Exaiptasia diaphana]|nr:hypothetical protein AC249_AIPGENE21410 [Exaiptasia diaphana]
MFVLEKNPALLSGTNLMGNRLSVPTSVHSQQQLVNVKSEPAEHDPSSPNSRSSVSPTSPYCRQTPSREGRDIDMADVNTPKRPRMDTTANGWR